MQNIHRPVSNRGQWRDTLTVYADGLPDPSTTVFTFSAWLLDGGGRSLDYGMARGGAGSFALAASTDDGTGRLSVTPNAGGFNIVWLFSAKEMRRLPAGSYQGSISAWIDNQMSEIAGAGFRFVVQANGLNDAGSLASLSEPLPTGRPSAEDIIIIVDGGEI